ncbi:MAG: sigma-70 family RNA polymerase sigma factor [Myxococcota bacterium]
MPGNSEVIMEQQAPKQPAKAGVGGVAQDVVLATYMRDVSRHALMTPDEEKARAESIVALRGSYWRHILGYTPYVQNVLDLVEGEAEFSDKPTAEIAALRSAASALKMQRNVAHRKAYEAATEALAARLATLDGECMLADRIASELQMLGDGHTRGLSLQVRPPRADSRPFAALLAAVRAASAAHTTERNRFAKANLRLVVRMAHRHRGSGLSIGDLVQEGNLGLLKAVDRFDPARGFRFSTYASWWIRHYMRRAIVNRSRTIRLPQHLHTLANKVSRTRRELRGRLGRDPSRQELAAAAQTSEAKLTLVDEALATKALSLDATTSGDDPRPIVEMLAAPTERGPGEDLDLQRASARLHGAILELDPMSRDILRQRFGLDGGEPRTLAEIGDQYSLSRERIRQLQVAALGRMRRRLGSAA